MFVCVFVYRGQTSVNSHRSRRIRLRNPFVRPHRVHNNIILYNMYTFSIIRRYTILYYVTAGPLATPLATIVLNKYNDERENGLHQPDRSLNAYYLSIIIIIVLLYKYTIFMHLWSATDFYFYLSMSINYDSLT